MTKEYLTNQLMFFSNEKYILDFLTSKNDEKNAPFRFSLSAIRKMPESLDLPMNPPLRKLSIMNMEMPSLGHLDDTVTEVVRSAVFSGHPGKQSESAISEAIDVTRKALNSPVQTSEAGKSILEVFEKAVANYHRHKFFCHYDWRFTRWGTVEDIHSAVESTFKLPSSYIEFQTRWSPPIPAMEALAGVFPSVRFELKYRYSSEQTWKKVEIFPNPPFSY